MKKRIGLFGGSFDPVHLGHLLVARAALEELHLDRVLFIPTQQSPFKPGSLPASPQLRTAMLRAALAGQTWCEVDEQEIERGGISYTIDTVRNYKARFPEQEFFYLIGADHVAQLPKWREASSLAQLLEFIIVPRPGQSAVAIPPGFRAQLLTGFPLGVSSSTIRDRVRHGLPIDCLVAPPVAEMIRNNRLYL